ncbi:hypothetical protein [Rhodopirellula sallentina]|nr:hypothetical protein [Rhodopirellula sallentina]
MSRVLSFLVFYFCSSLPLSVVAQDLGRWKNIASFRPSESIQKAVQARGDSWTVHRIEDGIGPINLDFYPIRVEKMPKIDGKRSSAPQLLEYVRTNLNDFVETDIALFREFKGVDKTKWLSASPEGAILIVDIEMMLGLKDRAPVVASLVTPGEWRFSTVRGGEAESSDPSAHPVAGNRAFGFVGGDSGPWTFYTVGADRANRIVDALATAKVIGEPGFKAADKLWRSFQTKLVAFINDHGGKASVDSTKIISKRYDWGEISKNKSVYDTSGQPAWVPVPQ